MSHPDSFLKLYLAKIVNPHILQGADKETLTLGGNGSLTNRRIAFTRRLLHDSVIANAPRETLQIMIRMTHMASLQDISFKVPTIWFLSSSTYTLLTVHHGDYRSCQKSIQ